MKTAKEKIRECVENLDDQTLVNAFNDYCRVHQYYDDIMYLNNDDELRVLLPNDPVDCFREGMITHCHGDYFCSDNYIRLDGGNHIVSCNASDIEIDVVVNYLLELPPRYLALALGCTIFEAANLLEDDEDEE